MDALRHVKDIYSNNFESNLPHMIEKVFWDVTDLFAGKMNGFHRCDTGYHDLQHTLKTVIVMAQIIDGWNRSHGLPNISQKCFDRAIVAALLHNVGYIRRLGDDTGTGAKHTFRHVKRSVEFAEDYLSPLGYGKNAIGSVRTVIWCTCDQTNPSNVTFSFEEDKIAAFSLGTADILAQMSAHDYLEKLPILFDEFREAYEYEGTDSLRQSGHIVFETLDELIEDTPCFYESWVKNRFKRMGSVYKSIRFHYGDGRNYCIESLEKNLEMIKSR